MLLEKELNQLKEYTNSFEKIKTSISSKSVGWHVDHSLKVINGVINALTKSNPKGYKWKFNMVRAFVFSFNYFPRGKGIAPKKVLPPEVLVKDDVYSQIVQAKLNLEIVITLPAKSNFNHPYFGVLDLRQTLKFLGLHTNHHLKICRDIVK